MNIIKHHYDYCLLIFRFIDESSAEAVFYEVDWHYRRYTFLSAKRYDGIRSPSYRNGCDILSSRHRFRIDVYDMQYQLQRLFR